MMVSFSAFGLALIHSLSSSEVSIVPLPLPLPCPQLSRSLKSAMVSFLVNLYFSVWRA